MYGAPACALWEIFQDDLAADFASNLAQSAAANAGLKSINPTLHKHGRSTDKYGLPKAHHENTEYDRLLGAFDRQELQELADQLIPHLTQEQKTVFDAITSSVTQEGGVYTIHAPAGTGKTFTETTIAASLRARGSLVLCTASTGIAAVILPGGLTAHPTFKLPFGPDAVSGINSTCNTKAESQRADVLKQAGLLTWDECPMSSEYASEDLDSTLRDLMNNDLPFGGNCLQGRLAPVRTNCKVWYCKRRCR